MNSKRKSFLSNHSGKNGIKNLVISIVILVELIAIAGVATFAWVETVSSIKIATESNQQLEVDTYVFTEATIGGSQGTIDMGKYFKQSGDMHFAPASSADGVNMFFPKLTANGAAYVSSGTSRFRKGNTSDMNTAYMSVTFKLKADTNADFFFDQVPTFSNQSSNMRVSVTAYTDGTSSGDLYDSNGKPKYTQIYANSDSASGTTVVGNTSGSAVATTYEAFADHIKGKGTTNRLFAVGANETKIVTIKVWLQGSSMNDSLPQNIKISNFGITSSLTPRHVTLLPTPTWDKDGATFYAWCYNASNGDGSRLYKLELDDNEHYSFDYNGTYRSTTFVRAESNCSVQPGPYNSWPFATDTDSNTNGYWNQTVDTTIPKDPIDPTYIIETISDGSDGKSTGSWHDPATVKVALCTGQGGDNPWGTLSATSYVGTTTSTHEIESTNPDSQKHKDTIHAWPGKKLQLKATAKTNYAFVGWYDNPEGIDNSSGDNDKHLLSSSATYTPNAPSTASEITYYAKFKEVRKITLKQYIDGSSSSQAATLALTSTGATATGDNTSKSIIVNKNATVTLKETLTDTGYSFGGFFDVQSGGTALTGVTTSGTTKSVNITADSSNYETIYYVRFTTNSYNVTATVVGSGGTVKTGSSTAGSTSTASVKYKSSVNVVATASSGYDFDGWYSASSGGNFLSADATYTVNMSTVGDKEVFAKFKQQSTTTIYMTYRGYSKMRVYVYGKSTGREYNGAFPGSTVPTYTSNRGLYSYSFMTGQDEDIGIIVSDNGSETARSEYTAHIGETILIGPSGSTINRSFTLGTKRYVYFTKNWTNNYIHYWGGSSGSTSWPGSNMTNKAYTNEYNQDVLYFVINTGNTAVIFHNNSGTQTGDTTLGSNSCFYFNGAGSAAGTWSPPTD